MMYGAEQWLMPVIAEMKKYLLQQEALKASPEDKGNSETVAAQRPAQRA
jgi:hypothetical protein